VKISRTLEHYTGRGALDVEGFGEERSRTLVEQGFIEILSDLYSLHERRDDLLLLPKLGEKSVDKLLANIEASKTQPLHRLLIGLSIRHVGTETARALALNFGSIEALRSASLEDLEAIDDIGPIVAQGVYEYFRDEENSVLVDRLVAAGVRTDEEISARGGVLDGLAIVVTGSLQRWSRNEIEDLIKGLGGRFSSAVSKKTRYVVTGTGGGSKQAKAETLGVEVIDEDEFVRRLEELGWTDMA
jgi:DNA ligase (NAD+)